MSALEEAPLIENLKNKFQPKSSVESEGRAPEENERRTKEEKDHLEIESSQSLEDSEESVLSMTQNISRVRLTLEEIIANDNESSRHNYLSPKADSNSVLIDDNSSVSSGLPSDTGSVLSFGSKSQSSSTFGFQLNDPFRGVDDDDFSNLDRFGFLTTTSSSASASKLIRAASVDEQEFIERERKKM